MKEKEKDEAYYVQKIKDLCKMKLSGKVLMVAEDDSNDDNVEVWSTDSEDHEVMNLTHGECYIMKHTKFVKEAKLQKENKL